MTNKQPDQVTASVGEVEHLPVLEHTGYLVTCYIRWQGNQFAVGHVHYIDGLEFQNEAVDKARKWREANKNHRSTIRKVRLIHIPAEGATDETK